MPWKITDSAFTLLVTSLTICVLAMITVVTVSYRNKEASLDKQSKLPSTITAAKLGFRKQKRSDSVVSARFVSFFSSVSK